MIEIIYQAPFFKGTNDEIFESDKNDNKRSKKNVAVRCQNETIKNYIQWHESDDKIINVSQT